MRNLKLSDCLNIVFLVIGLVGLYIAIQSYRVAVTQLEQATEDGKEQRKSLDASRAQLQAVVDTAKQQQEVLTQHLETSKAQLSLQQEVQQQEKERASRKPKLHVYIEGNSFDPQKMTASFALDGNKQARLPFRIRNIGSAPLHKAIISAVVSKKDVTAWFDGISLNLHERFKAEVSGSMVKDLLPFSVIKDDYDLNLIVSVPSGINSFDITYSVIGENLDTPFQKVFHINLRSE